MKLDLKYVTEVIKEEYKQWKPNQTVIIDTQTGTGKSTFIGKKIIPYAKENNKKVLYLYNRTSLGNQLKKELNDDNVVLVSYHTLANEIRDNEFGLSNEYHKYKDFDYIIYDECHYLLHDGIFNNRVDYVYNNFFTNNSNNRKAINIFMSATMKNIKGVIYKEYGEENIVPYVRPRDYSYLNPYYFERNQDIINTINNDLSGNKWIVFVPSISMGRNLKKSINKSKLVFSIYNNNYKSSNNEKLLEQIETDEYFDCKCLITTKALDNGINIKDDKLTNIVTYLYDDIDFLQMIGRKRIDINDAQTVNLYIHRTTNKYISKHIYNDFFLYNKGLIEQFQYNPQQFYIDHNDKLHKINSCLFRLNKYNMWELIDNGRTVFNLKKAYAEWIKKGLSVDYNYVIKQQLDLIGYEYDYKMLIKNVPDCSTLKQIEDYLQDICNRNDTRITQLEQEKLSNMVRKSSYKNTGSKGKMYVETLNNILIYEFKLNYKIISIRSSKRINGKPMRITYWQIIKTKI